MASQAAYYGDFADEYEYDPDGFSRPQGSQAMTMNAKPCSLSTLAIQLLSPQELTYNRGVLPIQWSTTGSSAPLSTVSIGIFYRQGAGDWQRIVEGTPNDGSYEPPNAWNTASVSDGNNYFFYIYAYESSPLLNCFTEHLTTKAIVIDNTLPAVAIDAPVAGAKAPKGSIQIKWNVFEAYLGTTQVEYSADGGASWIALAASLTENGAPGTLPWDTSGLREGDNYRIRITHTDKAGNAGLAVSGAFSIVAGSTSSSSSSSSSSTSSSSKGSSSAANGASASSQAPGEVVHRVETNVDGEIGFSEQGGAQGGSADGIDAQVAGGASPPLWSTGTFWMALSLLAILGALVAVVIAMRPPRKPPTGKASGWTVHAGRPRR